MWGVWAAGMASRTPGLVKRARAAGVGAITAGSGLRALAVLLSAVHIDRQRLVPRRWPPEVVAAALDWGRLLSADADGTRRGGVPAMFSEFRAPEGRVPQQQAAHPVKAWDDAAVVDLSTTASTGGSMGIEDVRKSVMQATETVFGSSLEGAAP
jgi:hypothetical protein